MIQEGTIFTHINNHIATITFGHPKSNAFPSTLLNKLVETINRLDQKQAVRVIVLKSEGEGAFCAGASFDELLQISTAEQGQAFFEGFAHVINAMRQCSKIIIARVQGKVVGGGVGLVAAADMAFASEKADIKLSELSIGIGPFVIEPAVSRKIGLTATNEMTLEPTKWQTAYWAKEKGLFAKVFESTLDLDKDLDHYTQTLSSYNPAALKQWKAVAWQGTDHWGELLIKRATISGNLVLSDFTKTALQKFRK